MNWFTRKLLYALHGWLGLHLGLLLFLICISGTIAVFTPEIDWLLDPARRVSPVEGRETASVGEIANLVSKARPQASLAYIIRSPIPSHADAAMIRYPNTVTRILFIDQYQREITGERSFLDAKSFTRIFHKQFYLVPTTVGFHGTWIVGLFSFVLLGSVITGLMAFKHPFRAMFLIRWNKTDRVRWSDIHRCLGAWGLAVALVISLTGLWYLGERAGEDIGMIDHDPTVKTISSKELAANRWALQWQPLDDLMHSARVAFPELKPTRIALPLRPGELLHVYGNAEAVAVRDQANSVSINPITGKVVSIDRAVASSALKRLGHSIDPVHFGTFGGILTRVIWFISGLTISIGILVGAYLYVLRNMRKSSPDGGEKRRGWIISGVATSLVIIMSALSATAFILFGQLYHATDNTDLKHVGNFIFEGIEASLYKTSAPEATISTLLLRFPAGFQANASSLQIRDPAYGNDATIRVRSIGNGLLGTTTLPAKTFHGFTRIRLTSSDTASIQNAVLSDRMQRSSEPAILPLSLPAEIPVPVFAFIAMIIILMLIPVFLWLGVLRF